ncbi:MAG: TonB-dependent receptor plug domain-containing protein [Maribacter sp.]
MKRILFIIVLFINITWGQEVINNTTICWDVSFSMLDRDLDKEFEILEKVVQRNPNQTIQLLLFNIEIEEKNFQIANGDWSQLKSVLIDAKADGATIYEGLKAKIKNNEVYFFTDGNRLLNGETLPVEKGNYVINSLPNRNETFLKQAALLGRGRLMDFAAILPSNIEASKSNMKEPTGKSISGTVYIDNRPSDEIEVRIKGSETLFKTDANGKFSIPAVPGDSILISSRTNRTTKTVPVGYFDKNVDVFLDSNITTLDEVIVTENRIDAASKEIVNTGSGLKNKESIGYAVQSMGEEDINPIQTDLNQSIQGRFSGVTLNREQDLTQFRGRSNNTILGNQYGLVVVDGVPIQQSNSSTGFLADATFINPDNVADITVLKGFAATNRYGTLGNGGVLLITTKSGLKGGNAKEGSANTALAQNNIYDPNAEISIVTSPIIKALEGEVSLVKAYEKYLDLRNFNENNDSFYLDAFEFFKNRDKRLAARIVSNLWERNPESESYLKLVELSMRYLNNHEIASVLNRQLSALKPTALQPFFTEGKLQLQKGNNREALDKFLVLAKGGTYGGMTVQAIEKSLDREIKNLLFQNRNNLNVEKVDEKYFKNVRMNVRLLVEWSNPKSEFQIQFVNPQNRFFNWEHTTGADKARIQEEVDLGYAMEEFELYDDLKGDWKINATYTGNLDTKSKEPLVLLCSVYTNFGYPSQTIKKVWIYLDAQRPNRVISELKI